MAELADQSAAERFFQPRKDSNKKEVRRRLWIYLAVAYGVTALMSILMYLGFRKDLDLTSFVNVQMMYPACGVILGKLITRREGTALPMVGYVTVLLTTAAMMAVSVCSLLIPAEPLDLGPAGTMDIWNLISQFPLMAGSVITYISFLAAGREKKEHAGILRRNIRLSLWMIVLFLLLYTARMVLVSGIADLITASSENIRGLAENLTNPKSLGLLLALPFNFFFVFAAFFGEEYGWRYYLQPVMQKRFGLKKGIFALGLAWAVWHIAVDFMYYTVEDGPLMFLSQIITCVSLAIFFGYAYMKTQNIWVPVILHYLNNNLIPVFSGGKMDVLQNQHVSPGDIPLMLAGALLYAVFIFAPVYRKKNGNGQVREG